jgi:hypothetical protein
MIPGTDLLGAYGDTLSFALMVRNALSPGRGVACRVRPADAARAVRHAAMFCLSKRAKTNGKPAPKLEAALDKETVPPEVIAVLENVTEASQRIVESEPDLIAATLMLGTHGGKVPDARMGLGAMVPDPGTFAAAGDVPGMHSGSVQSSHPLSGSGNAARNAQLRFLCCGISFEGGPITSLASILAEDCAANQAILAGFDATARAALMRIGDACRNRLSAGERGIPAVVDTYRSQVLFPIENGEYVALSPLYPYAIGGELVARLQARQWSAPPDERQRFDVRVAHVGGTKPQNTGLLATYLSGRFPRLVGMPPREFSRGSSIIKRFATVGLSVAGGAVRKESFSAFGTAFAAYHAQPNAVTRQAMNSAIGAMCLDVMFPLAAVAMENDFALATTGQPILAPDEIPAGSRDIAMALGMLVGKPTDDDFARMTQAVAGKIASRLRGKEFRMKDGLRSFVVDAPVMDMLAAIARQKIEEYT